MRVPVLVAGLLLAFPVAEGAADVLINNGLDCSNPGNVIDDGAYHSDSVYVRNAGCPPLWPWGFPWDDCPSPGDATEVCIEEGGAVEELWIYDSSTTTMNGGSVGHQLIASDSSTFTMNGGGVFHLGAGGTSTATLNGGHVGWFTVSSPTATIDGGEVVDLETSLSSVVTIKGGTVLETLRAFDSSSIVVTGTGFAVDGSPVPYGDLSAQTGTLTGRLASGDSIDCVFHQGGDPDCSEIWPCTGTITLAPPPTPVPALSLSGKLLLAAALLGVGLLHRRRSR